MKKSIFLFFAAILCAMTANAATKTIYVKTQQWWHKDGAATAAYYWGTGGNANAWPGTRMTKVEGETNMWSIEIDTDKYQNIIFTRVNGSGAVQDWGAKTKDQTIPTNDNNLFTLSTTQVWGDPGATGTWSTYTPPTEPVIPEYYITGTLAGGWSGNEVKMTYNETTKIHSHTFTAVAAGEEKKFKVTDGTWDANWGGDAVSPAIEGVTKDGDGNAVFTLSTAGDVTITFDGTNIQLTTTGSFTPVETFDYYVVGSFNGWNEKDPAHGMTLDGEVYKATVTLAAGENLVKVTNGTWTDAKGYSAMGAEYEEVSQGASDDNIQVDLTEGKDVVVVYNATTNKVTFEGLTEKAPEPTFDYYIVGSFNGNNPKKAENGMTLDGAVYKATVTLAAGDNMLKVTDGSWDNTWGYSNLGAAYEEVSNPNDYNNIKITLAAEKEITVIFDATAGKITFEGLIPYVAPLTYTVTVPAGTEKCYIAGNMNGWAFQEMEAVTGETNKFTITIVGAKETDEYKYACQADWAYAEVIDGGGNRTNWSELDEVTAWNKPVVYTYYLVGVDDDWKNGIEMEVNTDAENEVMLTCQPVNGEVKIKRVGDDDSEYWYGGNSLKTAEGSLGTNTSTDGGDGNILLEEGIYNFYFNTADGKLWIAAATDCVTEPTEKTIVEENAVCTIGRDGSLTMEGQELYVEIGEFDAENVLPEYIAVCTLLSTWDGGTCEAATATLNDNVLTLTGTFVTEESGETYKFTISGELPSGEVESKEVNVVVANLVVEYDSDSEVWVLFGTDDEYTFTLALNEEPVAEKEYTLNEDNSQVRYSRYRSFVTGSLTKQHDDTYGDMYVGQLSATFDDVPYTISLTMYNYTVVDAEPIDLFAEATYTIEDDMLTVVADWEGTPVQGILVGFENVSGQKFDEVWLSVGEGENELYISGSAVVTIEDGELAIEGVFSFADEEYYNVYIWGDIPATEPTPDYTRDVTSGNYGTICLPFGGTITGAVLYECVGSEPGKVYLGSVTTLAAGVPYIFQATATELAVYSDGTTATEAGSSYGLHGTFEDETEVAVGNYILLGNKLRPSDGEAKVNANRAYLVMSEVPAGAPQQMPGRRYIGMDVQGENEATGVEDLFTTDAPVKVIENGQLIIIRDGVKYNVQGQVIR